MRLLGHCLKYNSLDGYEFQLLFTETKTNFVHLHEPMMENLIRQGQVESDKTVKFEHYRHIADAIAQSCTIRPLLTIPL